MVQGCGGVWPTLPEVRKEEGLGIVMADGGDMTRGWLRRKGQLGELISPVKACAEMRTVAQFMGRKTEL